MITSFGATTDSERISILRNTRSGFVRPVASALASGNVIIKLKGVALVISAAEPPVVSGYAGRVFILDSRFATLFIISAFGGNDEQ